jgi:hypothetical protein
VAALAVKLFVAELVETAKQMSDSPGPLTPDAIIIAFNEMENHGKIPGKGPGIKRSMLR